MDRAQTNYIFIDVNGTLIAEQAANGLLSTTALKALRATVNRARSAGFTVGLCSDSPLIELIGYAQYLGFDRAVIAENGNILHIAGETTILGRLIDIGLYKQDIIEIATKAGYGMPREVVAPEFGGHYPDYSKRHWGFGAHRETSVSVFAPSELIGLLGKQFKKRNMCSLDCSPVYGYFAIHPGRLRYNKGRALSHVCSQGASVLMVGNSISDWVEATSGVRCAFVANAQIGDDIKSRAFFVSEERLCRGVCDIMERYMQSI